MEKQALEETALEKTVENWNTMEKPLACGTQRRSERIAAAAAATAAAAVALAGVLWQSWPLLRLLLSNAQCCKVESRSEYTPTLRVYGELPIRGEARRGEARRCGAPAPSKLLQAPSWCRSFH